MKKRLKALVTVLILVLSMTALAACSKDETPDPEPGTITTTPEATTEPTAEPTTEPTAEPTTEPTAEPTAEPTEEPAAEVTAEPTGELNTDTNTDENNMVPDVTGAEPDITDIEPEVTTIEPSVTGTEDGENSMDVFYKEMDASADAAAQAVAEEYINASLCYDVDRMEKVLAYDDDHKDEIELLRQNLAETKEMFGGMDFSALFKVRFVGGKAVSTESVGEGAKFSAMVDFSKVSDLNVFSAVVTSSFSGSMPSVMNVLVGKYEGSYKVLYQTTMTVDESEVPEDPEADQPVNLEEKMYKFNGNETADEIADLFIEAFQQLDLYKIVSCMACDDDKQDELFGSMGLESSDAEVLQALLSQASITMTRSNSESVDSAELDKLFENDLLIKKEDVSDVVKYPVHAEMTFFGQEQKSDTFIYIGKYKGEYRVIYTDSMDTVLS